MKSGKDFSVLFHSNGTNTVESISSKKQAEFMQLMCHSYPVQQSFQKGPGRAMQS